MFYFHIFIRQFAENEKKVKTDEEHKQKDFYISDRGKHGKS